MKYVLAVNTVFLLLATVFLAYFIIKQVDFKFLVNKGIKFLSQEVTEKKLQYEIKKYTHNITLKMSIPEKVDLYLIEKSNIRKYKYLSFFNSYILLIVMIILFALFFVQVYKVLYSFFSAAVISAILSFLPVFALDIAGRRNSEIIRHKLADFIAVLNRWCAVKEDIFYAFEKSVNSIGEPLKTYINDLVIQVKRGIDPLEALDILQLKVDNTSFNDFIINIKQNIKSRGNIIKLLTNMEEQFFKIEQEYNRRKISTLKDRILIYITIGIVLLVAYYFLKTNYSVRQFYLGSFEGKALMALFSMMFVFGIFLTFTITKFKY